MSPTVYTWTGRSSSRVPVGTRCARSARGPGSGGWSRKGPGSPRTSPSTRAARCASSWSPRVGYRTDTLSPLRRSLVVTDPEAAGTPILLIHGIMDNRSVFTVFRRALRRRGFGVVHAVNYGLFTGDLREAAHELRDHVERLCEATGADKVHIVGHSLGGVIARYYVQRLGGSAHVDTLVTLGSPHSGTLGAYLIPTALGRQLRPGSPPLTELAGPAPGAPPGSWSCGAGWTRWWCRSATRGCSTRTSTSTQLEVPTSGHLALPIDGRVVRWVVEALPARPSSRSVAERRPLGARPGRQPGLLNDTPDPEFAPRDGGSLGCRSPIHGRSPTATGRPRSTRRDPQPGRAVPACGPGRHRHREGQVLARHRSPRGAQEDDPDRTTRLRAVHVFRRHPPRPRAAGRPLRPSPRAPPSRPGRPSSPRSSRTAARRR